VAALLDDSLIRDRVEQAGFDRHTFDYHAFEQRTFEHREPERAPHRMSPKNTLITCKRYVAGFIVEQILEVSEKATGPLLLDCVDAIRAGLAVIDGTLQKR
jgi:hypothetical protein